MRYLDANEKIATAIADAGIDLAIAVPDGGLLAIDHALADDPRVELVQCAREDEGIAIAVGASCAGRRPAILMEGSGIGFSGLILARATAVNRAEVCIVASHNWTMGERMHYHAGARAAGEPLLRALNIPYHVMRRDDDPSEVFTEMLNTMSGQRTPVAVLLPRPVTIA